MKETEPSPENSICTLDPFPVSQFDGDLKGCMLYLSHVYIFLTHLLSLMSKNVDILKKGWSVYSYWSLFSSNSQKNENNGQKGRAHRNLTPILPYQISLIEQRHFHTSLCWNLLYHCQDRREMCMRTFFHCHTLSPQQLSLGSCKFLCPLASPN